MDGKAFLYLLNLNYTVIFLPFDSTATLYSRCKIHHTSNHVKAKKYKKERNKVSSN